MLVLDRGAEDHCLWFFVNRANALAPICRAFRGAFSTPPEALTCAPIYFILKSFSGITIIILYHHA
jgi:hypothetical protein